MPAPFAITLCGYRSAHGKPNTSDVSDAFSVELGSALFEIMGVDRERQADEAAGPAMASALSGDLSRRLADEGTGLDIRPEQPLHVFDQYRHVAALAAFGTEPSADRRKAWTALARFARAQITKPTSARERLEALLARYETVAAAEAAARRQVVEDVGEESLLKLDVAGSRRRTGSTLPSVELGLSLKWSLRTDRAQDCRSQGAKMAALRRGRMPHFAAVTMEPRPYMLNILGGGSGEIDCVYHLDLPSLGEAVEAICTNRGARRAKTLDTYRRLVEQRRLRDYDDLVAYARTL